MRLDPKGDLVAQLNAFKGEAEDRLGLVFTEVSRERVVATMPVEGNRQPFGLLHGGFSVALAETLGSALAGMHAPEGRLAVGLEINATHHRSARDGLVTGTATLVSAGRTTATTAIAIRDDQDRLVCSVRLTCYLRETRT
jgi:1,4-dihydroxy-2-naphthoyl-CoA hydrolase